MTLPGRFFAIEGADGVGKTTVLARVVPLLEQATGRPVLAVREPGGTALGELIRDAILHPKDGQPMSPIAQLLAFCLARRQLIDYEIAPALDRGEIVLADRFALSTHVYQGTGLGVAAETVDDVLRAAIGDVWPDATLVLQLPPEVALARRMARAGTEPPDLLEANTELMARAAQAYATAALRIRDVHMVDATGTPDEVAARVAARLTPWLQSPLASRSARRTTR